MTSTMTNPGPATIAGPGFYPDVPEADYHADPIPGGSLSSTGARKLLAPSSPAKFRWMTDNPQPPKQCFDLGSATHTEVLGAGPAVKVLKFDNWSTKAAKDAKAEAHANGLIPVLEKEWSQVQAMTAAVRAHPLASQLFVPGRGEPEMTVIAQDSSTDVWMRARLDWMSREFDHVRIVDLKTTGKSVDTESLSKSIADFGYHQQAAFYMDAVTTLDPAATVEFIFVFVETDAPHGVRVIRLDDTALEIGRDLNREALEVFAECTASGVWPDYPPTVETVGLPAWAVHRHQNR